VRQVATRPHATVADRASRGTVGTHLRPFPGQGLTPFFTARSCSPLRHDRGSCAAWLARDAPSPSSGRALLQRPDRAERGHLPPRRRRESRAAWHGGDAPPPCFWRALPRLSGRAARGHSPPRHGRGSRVAWHGGDTPPSHTNTGRGPAPPHLASVRPRGSTPGGPSLSSPGGPPPFQRLCHRDCDPLRRGSCDSITALQASARSPLPVTRASTGPGNGSVRIHYTSRPTSNPFRANMPKIRIFRVVPAAIHL